MRAHISTHLEPICSARLVTALIGWLGWRYALLFGFLRFVFKVRGTLLHGYFHSGHPRRSGVIRADAVNIIYHGIVTVLPKLVILFLLRRLEGEPDLVVVERAQRVAVMMNLFTGGGVIRRLVLPWVFMGDQGCRYM